MPRRVYKDISHLVHNLTRARNPRIVDPGPEAAPAIVEAIKAYEKAYLPPGITINLPACQAESLIFMIEDTELGPIPVNVRPSLSRAFYMTSDLPRCPAHPALNRLQSALMQTTTPCDLVLQAVKAYEARHQEAA